MDGAKELSAALREGLDEAKPQWRKLQRGGWAGARVSGAPYDLAFLQNTGICRGQTLSRSSTIEHSAQTARMVLRAEGQGIPGSSARASSPIAAAA